MKSSYINRTYTVPANGGLDVLASGNFYRLLSATGTVQVGSDGSDPETLPVGVGVQEPGGFGRLRLVNPGGADISVTVAVGAGVVSDDRFTVSGTISTSEVAAATMETIVDQAIAAGGSYTVPAKSTRKELLVCANGELRFGDVTNTGAGRGVRLLANSPAVISTAGAVKFHNPGAAPVTLTITEVVA